MLQASPQSRRVLSVVPMPSPSFLRRQELTHAGVAQMALNVRRRREAAQAGRRGIVARTNAGVRLGSCLRRNDGSVRMTEAQE